MIHVNSKDFGDCLRLLDIQLGKRERLNGGVLRGKTGYNNRSANGIGAGSFAKFSAQYDEHPRT